MKNIYEALKRMQKRRDFIDKLKFYDYDKAIYEQIEVVVDSACVEAFRYGQCERSVRIRLNVCNERF